MNDTRRTAATVETEAADWLARRDGDCWNDTLQQEFDAWLDADTRHRVAWLRLRAAWNKAEALHGQPVRQAAPPLALPRFSPWRIAAGVLLAVSLGALLIQRFPGEEPDATRYATRVGESRVVALGDGSRLTLNTDTRLRAAPDAGRKVWLDGGEAYFDIAHDPTHPFVIEAGASRVTVLGTRFTVRREADGVRVVVAEGRVRLSEQDRSVELARNEEAVAGAQGIVRTVRTAAQTEQRLAWRDGRIVFDGTTLADAAAEFNRYNARKIVVADPAAASIAVGGSFAPANVEGFVRLLERGFGLHADRSGKDIVVSR